MKHRKEGAAEMGQSSTLSVDIDSLRTAIRAEYAAVAEHPTQGFHFHTGARLAAILGYREEWLAELPASASWTVGPARASTA